MTDGYFETRLAYDHRRTVLWKALWKFYFSRKISAGECVLELGCGYGDFINNVTATKRIAVDQWPQFPDYLDAGVTAIVSSVTDLSAIPDQTVDFAFASNLFEHLTVAECEIVLTQLILKLRPGGRFTLIQPNYRYCSAEYFDDYTHITAWSHISLADFLTKNGFVVSKTTPKFLPLTLKSRLPVSELLIGIFLASPIKPFAKQMIIETYKK